MNDELEIQIHWEEKEHFDVPPTPEEILRERMSICVATGTNPFEVMNFWEGLENTPGAKKLQDEFERRRFSSVLHEDYFA